MCGIAGVIKYNEKVYATEIIKMCNTMTHRGPDGSGVFAQDNFGIGHRRLAIIDVEAGKQPMSCMDGQVWISYNGELYNFQELRKELIELGHQFCTLSDTEVVLKAYLEWGCDGCLSRFRGMFAFSIIDLRNNICFIARDHLGIKPLIYYKDNRVFAFASEIQALTQIRGFNKETNYDAIDQYLWLQYIPAPNTIYKHAHKLLPGHYIIADLYLENIQIKKYYDYEFCPNSDKSEDEWLSELDEVLLNSVKKHLVSDVPFGAFLSGGIDSTLVVDYMTRILGQPVETFSICFEGEDYSDAEHADYAAKLLGTRHHLEMIQPNALEILPEIVKKYGEPFGESSAIPLFYVSKLASKHVKMVLTGDGGDELFAGYGRYNSWLNFCDINHLSKRKLSMWLLALWRKNKAKRDEIYGNKSLDNAGGGWICFVQFMNKDIRSRLWRKEYGIDTTITPEEFERAYQCAKKCSDLQCAQYMDMKTYIPFDILVNADIASMTHSLELRTPLIDREVLAFALSIPEKYNYEKRGQNEYQGKILLKKLMSSKYSSQFLYRPKRGFSMPLSKWFKDKTSYAWCIKERLLQTSAKINDLFDPSAIRALIETDDYGSNIWLLLFLEEWLIQNG